MTITDRNLPAGTLLKATHKGASYLANIVTYQDEKNLTVEIIEGQTDLIGSQYSSLSKAAMRITGNSVNGWRFWTLAAQPSGKIDRSEAQEIANAAAERIAKGDDERLADAIFGEGNHDVGRVEGSIDLTAPAAAQEPASGPLDPDQGDERDTSIDRLQARVDVLDAASKRRKAEAKARRFNPIKRTANQKGLAEGITRMFCAGCMKSFTTALDPESFKADDAECHDGHKVGDMREAALGASGEQD